MALEIIRAQQRMMRACGRLLDFTLYTKSDYEVNWHHRLLAEYLDRFVAGEIKRLMVFMPPRHGKSELVSRRLPAYILGKHPDATVLACSHTVKLATEMSCDVQRIMESDEYRRLFPGTRIPAKGSRDGRRTNEFFEVIERRGRYRSAGLGVAIAGIGFDWGIIDDPIPGEESSDSPTQREAIWQWYLQDFYTRRQHDARILITLTRWHRDDLAGRLLRKQAERDADQWEVLSLPGLCKADAQNQDDPRTEGEALWPSFMDEAEHAKTREQDLRSYAALYDQDPAEAAGAEWPPAYFGEHVWCGPEQWPRKFDLRVICVDPSKGKQDKTHDYSAIVFVGVHNGLVYVDADMEKRPPAKIVRDTLRMCERYKPDMVGFEANQFQELLAEDFERATQRNFTARWPVYKILSKLNKVVRIRRLGPYLANHELRFRADSPGCRLLVEQLIDFPLADHDDGPDALEMAVRLPVDVQGMG